MAGQAKVGTGQPYQEKKATPGLRERQKEDRRSRIVDAARQLFANSGLEDITIEAIAEIAGVSSVTVHNYYGTKSGVLLALVAESDRQLLETLQRELAGKTNNLVNLLEAFLDIICQHTLTHLDKAIWRQVIASSVNDTDPRFAKVYTALDERLADVLITEIKGLQAAGHVSPAINPGDLGKALFNLQNMRFIEFIATDMVSKDSVVEALKRDITALLAAKQV